MIKCEFKPFAQAAEVCDRCGEMVTAAVHAGSGAFLESDAGSRYQKDIWAVLLRLGGFYNLYSGELDRFKTAVLWAHLGIEWDAGWFEGWSLDDRAWDELKRSEDAAQERGCRGIDWHHSGMPEMGTVSQFEGTFTECSEHMAVVGHLWCTCRKYVMKEVAVRDKTMGQIIWHVVRMQDEKEGRSA